MANSTRHIVGGRVEPSQAAVARRRRLSSSLRRQYHTGRRGNGLEHSSSLGQRSLREVQLQISIHLSLFQIKQSMDFKNQLNRTRNKKVDICFKKGFEMKT